MRPEFESRLHQYIMKKGRAFGAIMHGTGGIEDHIHVVFSLPPKMPVADFVGKIKGASSHWVNHVLKHPNIFKWQREYGVVSFSGKDLPKIIAYVENQKEHHAKGSMNRKLEMYESQDK